jgi:hypothetical protein
MFKAIAASRIESKLEDLFVSLSKTSILIDRGLFAALFFS